jgi:hypothetical protein
LERSDEAEAALNNALATGNINPDGAYLAARMFERQGRDAEAARLAAKALETKPPFMYRTESAEIVSRWQARDAAAAKGPDKGPAAKN